MVVDAPQILAMIGVASGVGVFYPRVGFFIAWICAFVVICAAGITGAPA